MDRSKKIRILERVGIFLGTILLLYLLVKFATYFMPFLIAGIIAVLIEPVIKFCMNKLKLSRRVSSVIIVALTIILLILAIVFGSLGIIKEIGNLSSNIGPAITTTTRFIDSLSGKVSEIYPDIPENILIAVESSLVDFVGKLGNLVAEAATKLVSLLLSVPTMIINTVITILALIFFTKDRIYVIDMMEHHMPKSWIKKCMEVGTEIFSTIGGYIRVYAKILFITFVELYVAFIIINAIGFKIDYPLILAMVISIVDILPILGVGTVLIPWALWMLVIGNWGLALALIITYGVIFCIRQFLEPKLVSKQFGIHPLITLFAMYAGYKSSGVFGLILGPVLLMVLRCVFAKQIEKGLFKDMFEEK